MEDLWLSPSSVHVFETAMFGAVHITDEIILMKCEFLYISFTNARYITLHFENLLCQSPRRRLSISSEKSFSKFIISVECFQITIKYTLLLNATMIFLLSIPFSPNLIWKKYSLAQCLIAALNIASRIF